MKTPKPITETHAAADGRAVLLTKLAPDRDRFGALLERARWSVSIDGTVVGHILLEPGFKQLWKLVDLSNTKFAAARAGTFPEKGLGARGYLARRALKDIPTFAEAQAAMARVEDRRAAEAAARDAQVAARLALGCELVDGLLEIQAEVAVGSPRWAIIERTLTDLLGVYPLGLGKYIHASRNRILRETAP